MQVYRFFAIIKFRAIYFETLDKVGTIIALFTDEGTRRGEGGAISNDSREGGLRNYSYSTEISLQMDSSANNCSPGATKRCRLSWLTNRAVVNEPKCGGIRGGGVAAWVSANEYSSTQEI
jgi:hypothetical protein